MSGQYVVFAIETEFYGLPIEQVEQIMHAQPVTRIPQVSGEILGVINLRGKTINVIDTRALLGFDRAEAKTYLVVSHNGRRIALTADRVDCITSFSETDIEKSPDTDFRVGKQPHRLVVLTTTDQLLDGISGITPSQQAHASLMDSALSNTGVNGIVIHPEIQRNGVDPKESAA